MQFAQSEFLLLSRTGRTGAGTTAAGELSPEEWARLELVAPTGRLKQRRARRLRVLRSRAGAAVTAAVSAKRS